jgi:hypothetical protein
VKNLKKISLRHRLKKALYTFNVTWLLLLLLGADNLLA